MKIKRKAFTITEIVVATGIFSAVFIALYFLTTSSRTETAKSINYLRALQLAQETVDWINSTPFNKVTKSNLAFLEGSLVDPGTGNSVKIPVGNNAKSTGSPTYPKEYSKCYFYRTIKIDDLSSSPVSRFLKKITVGIYWNEGRAPKKIEAVSGEPDRMRKLILSTLIFNEKEYY